MSERASKGLTFVASHLISAASVSVSVSPICQESERSSSNFSFSLSPFFLLLPSFSYFSILVERAREKEKKIKRKVPSFSSLSNIRYDTLILPETSMKHQNVMTMMKMKMMTMIYQHQLYRRRLRAGGGTEANTFEAFESSLSLSPSLSPLSLRNRSGRNRSGAISF